MTSNAMGKQARVLLVEDSTINQRIGQQLLTGLGLRVEIGRAHV